jgi:hypothetical protein
MTRHAENQAVTATVFDALPINTKSALQSACCMPKTDITKTEVSTKLPKRYRSPKLCPVNWREPYANTHCLSSQICRVILSG